MTKVAVFSRNLIYALGGAERSLYEELKEIESHVDFVFYYLSQEQYKSVEIDYSEFSCVQHKPFTSRWKFSRFVYYEYMLNRRLVQEVIAQCDCAELIAQNRWAPAAILKAKELGLATTYYLRDETSYGHIANYYSGYQKVLKDIYKFLEAPGIRLFCQDNRDAILMSDRVIANSNFVAECVYKKYGRRPEVVTPHVDLGRLEAAYKESIVMTRSGGANYKKTIVLIGDTVIKGVNIFIELSQRLPDFLFVCYGKGVSQEKQVKNLLFKPWSRNPAGPYAVADLLLVPSVWDEAFGRVSIEAQALGIPVIVSNRGGLPETVGYNKDFIASTVEEFEEKIMMVLT